MGNKQSKPETPYTILNVEPTTPRQEVKQRYYSLLRQNHPLTLKKDTGFIQVLNDAYNTLCSTRPNPLLYTQELLSKNLALYADDFFMRICEHENVVGPKFSDPDFVYFYAFFSKFKTKDSEYTKECKKVLKVVREMDCRLSLKDIEVVVKKPGPVFKRSIKVYKYSCEECNKGFMSISTLINHYKSKKHASMIKTEDFEGYVDRQIADIMKKKISNVSSTIVDEEINVNSSDTKDSNLDNAKWKSNALNNAELDNFDSNIDNLKNTNTNIIHGNNLNELHVSKPKNNTREPEIFRTCTVCKSVFGSRRELTIHLKKGHSDQTRPK